MNEDLFIIKASTLKPADEDLNLLRTLAVNGLDWPELYKKAWMHGVTPLMYHTLTKNSLSDILPQDCYADFKSDYYQTAIRNSNLLQIIDRVANKVKKKIILLKGADLTQYLYPSIGIRPMGDIDILVEREDAQLIREQLYEDEDVTKEIFKSSVHKKLIEIMTKEQTARVTHLPAVLYRYGALEIHWHLFGGTDSYYLTKNALNSAFSAKKSNYIYRLSPEFMLLHLCSHLYSHASRVLCLRMFCDINELLRNHESVIDWEVVYENTKSIDFKEKIFTVLLLVRSIFKTPLPEIILKENKLLMECVSLDSLRNGFLPKETALVNNKFSEYIINIKKLKKQSDRLLLLYRTLFPEKEWLEYYYQETNTCKNTENLSARFFFEYLKNKFNSS